MAKPMKLEKVTEKGVMPTEPERNSTNTTGSSVVRGGDASILGIIAAAASDSRVDMAKLSALLDLKERIDAKDAKVEFTKEFALMQCELPRVSKHGIIEMGNKGKIPFARWEDVDAVLRPIMSKHGFALSFSTDPVETGVHMTATLSHLSGHSVKSEMRLPPDQGPGRNNLQAIGSARSYAKRYLTCDLLNIVTTGEDDDGNGTGFITEEQSDKIADMFVACEFTQEQIQAVLKWTNPERPPAKVSELPAAQFKRVMSWLQNQHKKIIEGA